MNPRVNVKWSLSCLMDKSPGVCSCGLLQSPGWSPIHAYLDPLSRTSHFKLINRIMLCAISIHQLSKVSTCIVSLISKSSIGMCNNGVRRTHSANRMFCHRPSPHTSVCVTCHAPYQADVSNEDYDKNVLLWRNKQFIGAVETWNISLYNDGM